MNYFIRKIFKKKEQTRLYPPQPIDLTIGKKMIFKTVEPENKEPDFMMWLFYISKEICNPKLK